MSNNLVSEQLPISSIQMDSSISEMPMGVVGAVGYVSGHSMVQQVPLSNKQTALGLDNPLSHGLTSTEMQMRKIEAKGVDTSQSQQYLLPNNQTGQTGSTMNSVEQVSAPLKRKALTEPISQNLIPETLSIPQKRVAQMLHRPWLQQLSAQNKKMAQPVALPNSPGSLNSPASNKKLVKTDSFSNKSVSQRTPTPKSQSARGQPLSKSSTESSESVRSKMREQLAAALSLVTEQGNKSSPVGNRGEAVNSQETQRNSQPADAVVSISKESNSSVENFSAKKNYVQVESQKLFPDVKSGDSTSIYESGGFQPSYDLSYEDVPFSENFFVKDELLQGNGLSWVLDPVLEMTEKGGIQADEKLTSDGEELGGDGAGKTCHQSPEDVAFEIEAELFKLFGGVNKKYKEKGRSLLFNLKDRNNPELRERVMAGEISPKRLCSMTAEELASKELSQWRMAKAEELAQMVVLPDTEVDIRRIVRKTHKGEFQVEVEEDDNIPADVSGGSSSLGQRRPESKDAEFPTKRSVKKARMTSVDGKGNQERQNLSHALTIHPNEGTDLMQGLMVDDELKDVDFLPPIVSLDEFMESLDSEPPFDNLPLDSERTPRSEKDDSEARSGSKSPELTTKDMGDTSSERRASIDSTRVKVDTDVKSSDSNVDSKSNDDHADAKSRDSRSDVKSSGSHSRTETERPLSGISKADHVWEGSLQLNISSTSNVIGVFKSGEKASTNKWPELIEIKGRVRLDAFEKFLNQLPLSRSRAVMVVHFVLQEGSSESDLSSLQEVSESYVLDERVGFAEPTTGVELYFCPPHNKTLEMLGKVIKKEDIEALNKLNNGLIGVIVWRKLSSTSPKSSSRHKHSSKKQHFTSRKLQDSKLNSNFASEPALRQSRPPPPDHDDGDDDVPPGFGPSAPRDEDDLPEFNFAGTSNLPVSHFPRDPRGPGTAFRAPLLTSRPVEQVRELIHKYGQSNATASPVPSWNDDDDDIPEWQPQAPLQQVHNFHQQPIIRPHYVNQQQMGLVPQQQPAHQAVAAMPSGQAPISANSENPALWQQQQQQGAWWPSSGQPSGVQTSNLNCQPDAGQCYGAPGGGTASQPGMAWQQNVSKSRGF